MQKRPSFKKLLSYGKEVNDGFAKSAKATIDSLADSLLPAHKENQSFHGSRPLNSSANIG
jgi:hypothetical protein